MHEPQVHVSEPANRIIGSSYHSHATVFAEKPQGKNETLSPTPIISPSPTTARFLCPHCSPAFRQRHSSSQKPLCRKSVHICGARASWTDAARNDCTQTGSLPFHGSTRTLQANDMTEDSRGGISESAVLMKPNPPH